LQPYFNERGCAPVNLIWAVSDAESAGACKGSHQGRVLAYTHSTVGLYAVVDYPLKGDGNMGFDQGQHLACAPVFVSVQVHHGRRFLHQEPAGFDMDSSFGYVLQNGCVSNQWFAKGLSRLNALHHERQATLCLPNEAHAVVDSAWAQTPLADLEATALSEEDVGQRHSNVFEETLHVPFGRVVIAKCSLSNKENKIESKW